MVLELHVWGTAFSLPSIDAQCIAAIAYLTQAVPRGEWLLVASSDPSLSPTNELPALRNENVWVGGFRNIVDYVSQFSRGKWSLDAGLEGREKADCIAFSSFIEAHGQPLIDLSLYVSSQNYTAVTRPIYSTIQPFPLVYITPPSIRSAAKSRTSHLGLSSLDIDSDPTPSSPNSQKDEDIIPPSLRKPRATVSSLLSQTPESAAQIRLDALATSFFEPLQSLRGKKRFFVSQSATSLDCLALGYLALALLPDLPSPWLANCMRSKFPQLCAFVHDLQRSFFGGGVSPEDAYLTSPSFSSGEEGDKERERKNRAAGKGALPWFPPERRHLVPLTGILASSIADSLPIVSQFRQATRLRRELESMAEDEDERQHAAEIASMQMRELWTTTASIVAGVSALVGFMFYYGLLGRLVGGGDDGPREDGADEEEHAHDSDERAGNEDQNGLSQFGDAGAALEVLFGLESETDRPAPPPTAAAPEHSVVQVELDSR